MNQPAISVVIPVYNGERHLAAALASVLEQSHPPQQVIVVDDGSTDGSAAVAQTFGSSIEYVHRENKGAGAARNAGVQLATGSLLAFLDADDEWTPHKLDRQLSVLKSEPEFDAVFGHVEQFLSAEAAAGNAHIPVEIMPGYVVGTMLIRRPAFDAVGPFAENTTLGEFVDWYARLTEQGVRVKMLDEVLLRRRIHGDNIGVRESGKRQDYVRILKASLDRRRQASSPQTDSDAS